MKKLLTLLVFVTISVCSYARFETQYKIISNSEKTAGVAGFHFYRDYPPEWEWTDRADPTIWHAYTDYSVNIEPYVTILGEEYTVTTIISGGISANNSNDLLGWTFGLNIPNTVTTIKAGAFSNNEYLAGITIPNSVTSIEGGAFSMCTNLSSLKISNSVTSIENFTFSGCKRLTSITIPNSVTSIGNSAFTNCSSLTSVTIPDSVTSIRSYAFSECSSLTSVTIGNSVSVIEGYAFLNCNKLDRVNIEDISAWCNISFTEFGANPLECAGNLYLNNELIKDLIIPNSVTHIGNYAFSGCNVRAIAIPNSVTSIGNFAFSDCSNLTSITIPTSVTSIEKLAFYGCNALPVIDNIRYADTYLLEVVDKSCTSAVIKDGTTWIGSEAFRNCSNLASVTIPNSVTNIGASAFYGCSNLTSVTIPNNVTSIGDGAFSMCTNLSSLKISNSVTSIEDDTFYGCSGLTSVTIPNNVSSIGASAFYGCSGLTSVTIPNNVSSIGASAFYDCSSLTSVTIPNNVTSIGASAFYGCSGLQKAEFASLEALCNIAFKSSSSNPLYYAKHLYVNGSEITRLVIPNNVTSIGTYAFYGCSDLTLLTIPTSVTSIGNYAFSNCARILEIHVGWDEPLSIGATTFNNMPVNHTKLYVPIGSYSKYATATGWREFYNIMEEEKTDEAISTDVTPRPTSGNYMFVDYLKAKAKQTVQIPVELVTTEENIVGFQCNIKLPEGMEFVKNAKGNVVFTWNDDRVDGHTISSKIAADGSVKLLAASMNGSTFMETEGVMFYFSATLPEGMEGEQTLQLYNVRVSDIDDNEIRCPDMTSVIDVKTYTLGDLNDDGEWSVVDVTMAIKAILDETYIEAGDMNEDGEMSVVDATTIIKYVLNEGPIEKASAPAAKMLKANAIADKAKLVVSPIYVEPGTNNMYLTIDMLNKEEYIGFQTEICLPEGFKFYTNSKGKPTVTLNTDRLDTHTASSKLKDERTLRILVASMDSDPILDNEGELLRVRVVADADVEAGNHTATLIDSRVSDDNDVETKLDVTNGYLRVFGEEAISLVVPEGGYATLCLPYNATVPAGLKAYKATGMKNGMVVIEEQTSIAACTPMIIEGTAGTYNFSGDNSDADEFEYSVGSLKSSLVPVENNSGYVLQNLSEGLGFYKIADALTVPSFRCVLDGAFVSAAPAFVPVGFDEDANAISSVETAMKNGSAVYTLDGKRVKTMEKGKIYVVGGVKMIVK